MNRFTILPTASAHDELTRVAVPAIYASMAFRHTCLRTILLESGLAAKPN